MSVHAHSQILAPTYVSIASFSLYITGTTHREWSPLLIQSPSFKSSFQKNRCIIFYCPTLSASELVLVKGLRQLETSSVLSHHKRCCLVTMGRKALLCMSSLFNLQCDCGEEFEKPFICLSLVQIISQATVCPQLILKDTSKSYIPKANECQNLFFQCHSFVLWLPLSPYS